MVIPDKMVAKVLRKKTFVVEWNHEYELMNTRTKIEADLSAVSSATFAAGVLDISLNAAVARVKRGFQPWNSQKRRRGMTFWGDGPDHLGLHAIAGKARKIVVILSSKETKVKKDLALLLEQKNEVAAPVVKPKPPKKKKVAKRKRATTRPAVGTGTAKKSRSIAKSSPPVTPALEGKAKAVKTPHMCDQDEQCMAYGEKFCSAPGCVGESGCSSVMTARAILKPAEHVGTPRCDDD